MLNIGGSYNAGSPTRSLYHFRLLLMLCDDIGFHLAQDCFWFNPAKLPTPAEWVNVRRIRVKDSVEYVWWLSKSPFPKADNRRALTAYSTDMRRLIDRGYRAKDRPSGHRITSKFRTDHGGAIPANVIERGNNESNSEYIRRCEEAGQKPHPARFPAALPRFFIELASIEGDCVLDPLPAATPRGPSPNVWVGVGRRSKSNLDTSRTPSFGSACDVIEFDAFVALARAFFPEGGFPRPFDAPVALHDIRSGRLVHSQIRHHLRKRVAEIESSHAPVQDAYCVDPATLPAKDQQRLRKSELMLGQPLLGELAEQTFEAIYRARLGGSEFRLDDYRASRNDTHYRVLNGGGRPLFRINSKFHGFRFRQARDLVGLDPADCFPLATYKIFGATQREAEEHLPYLFLVISTPITAESVVTEMPSIIRELARIVHASKAPRKRTLKNAWFGGCFRRAVSSRQRSRVGANN